MTDYTAPHWHRAALVIIDMQRDFADGTSAVAGTERIVGAVARLAEAFRHAHRPIAHVVRFYEPFGSDVDPVRRARVESGAQIAAPGTTGAQIVPELLGSGVRLDADLLLTGAPQQVGPREIVLYKPRWSAFYRTELEAWLRENGCDTVVVAGCNLPNCPRATLFDASERDLRAVAVADALSQTTAERLADLKSIGVRVVPVGVVHSSLGFVRNGVALYPFGPEFAADSYALTTPTLTRFMSWERAATSAEFERTWRAWMDGRDAGTEFVYAVVDPHTGEFLGQVGVHHADRAVPELGIWIREDRHGQGYGRRAVAAARDWACETFPAVEAFEYPVAQDNTASRRIAEGLGGTVVDRYRSAKFPVVVYRIPVVE